MKDGIDAFNIDQVAPLLFVVNSRCTITHNSDILQVQSLVIIGEFRADMLTRMKVDYFGRLDDTNATSTGILHHGQCLRLVLASFFIPEQVAFEGL